LYLQEQHALHYELHKNISLQRRVTLSQAEKIQLFKPKCDQDIITRAHEKGLVVNVFWSDDVQEAKTFLEMGIDTILTNDYFRISQHQAQPS
jgi:glycerophosphoryl diester phosphodiesterase